jgi:hypothetical protein
MICGLRHIPPEAFIDKDGKKKRVKIHMESMVYEGLNKELMDRISDEYEYIENVDEYIRHNPTCKRIKLHGELINKGVVDIKECYIFLRKLLMKDYIQPEKPFRKIFITRKDSHLLLGNKMDNFIRRRQIVNDSEVFAALEPLGFEYIQLENYGLMEKIKIFSEAEVILSPNSGGLTFLIFAHPNTKVIEYNTSEPHQVSIQFKIICDAFNLNYKKMFGDKIDEFDNMFINIDEMLEEVTGIKKTTDNTENDNTKNNSI